jgi:hypothetical protein
MFEELLGSVREAGAILRGQQKPSRRIVIRTSKLGTGPAAPHGPGSRIIAHH